MAITEMNPDGVSGVVDPMGGANQTRVRAYNERLVLSLVRRHGSLSKAEIASRIVVVPLSTKRTMPAGVG